MDGCFKSGRPSMLLCFTIPGASVLISGSCTARARLGGAAGGGTLPRLGRSQPRKMSVQGPICPTLLTSSQLCPQSMVFSTP